MSFVIKDIFSIDAEAISFVGENDETIYPSKAYEIHAELEGQRIQTYGVVWETDNQQPGCFLSEELDEHLAESFPSQYTEKVSQQISSLIFQKHMDEDVDLPLVIWES